jgi:hypothetical protein
VVKGVRSGGRHSGDTGQTLNLELQPAVDRQRRHRGPVPRASSPTTAGSPYRAPGSTLKPYESLTGAGWGMNVAMGKSAYARLTVGYGATEVPNQPRNYEITLQFVASVF